MQIEAVPIRYETYKDTLDRFEHQQTQTTEERYIATGNLLRGYGWLNRIGQILNYTDRKGAVQQGIMLPRNYDLAEHAAGQGRTLATPNEVMDELKRQGRMLTVSSKEMVKKKTGSTPIVNLGLSHNGMAVDISIDPGRSTGGRFYLDKDLNKLTDVGDFIKRGNPARMEARVGEKDAHAAIGRLQALGATFIAPVKGGLKTEKIPDEDETPQASIQTSLGLTEAAEMRRLLQVPTSVRMRQRLEVELQALMERMIGKSAKFQFPDSIPMHPKAAKAWGDIGKTDTALGMTLPAHRMIQIAMGSGVEKQAAIHEVVHWFMDFVATKQQKDLAKRETPRLRKIVQPAFGFTDDQMKGISDDEIHAMAGDAILSARMKGEEPPTGVHVGIRQFFERIWRAIKQLGEYIRSKFGKGTDAETYEELMNQIYEGKFKDRSEAEARGYEEGKRAALEAMADTPQAAIRASRPRDPAMDRIRDRISDVLRSDTAINLKEGLHDYNERVRLMRNDVEAMYNNWRDRTGNLPDEKDFYELKRLFPNKKSARIDVFDKEHLHPLEKWLRANKFDLDAAGRYLTSLHVPERNREIGKLYPAGHNFNRAVNDHDVAGGSGFSWNEAKKMNEEANKGPYKHLLPELRRRMAAIRDWTQQEMRRGRLESQATIDKWNKTYKNYINMSGWEDPLEEPEEVALRSMGRKKNAAGAIAGPEVKTAFGRKTLADNPISNAIKSAYRTIERAEKNLVLLPTAKALGDLPGDARRELGVRLDRGAPVNIIDPHTGLARQIANPADRFSNRAVPYKVDGNTHFMLFDDPRIAEAMGRWSPSQLGGALRVIQTIQQKWKSLITIYSPSFEARHQARYYIENMLNALQLKETGHYNPGKLAREAFPIIGEATRAIFDREGGRDGGRLGRYWDEMKADGGATALNAMRDMDSLKDDMRVKLANLESANMNPLRWLRETAGLIHKITSIMDNAQRLTQYAAARDQGQSRQKAAIVAAEATVDYNMRGLWSNYISLPQPFFNVAEKTGTRMWGRQPRSAIMRKVMLATFAAGLAMSAWNYAAGGTDTDGIPFVDKVAPWEANKALVIMLPWIKDENGRPGVLKLPFPFNWAFPLSAGSAIGNFIWGSGTAPQIIMQRIVGPFISTFSQVGEEGLGLNTLLPEVMKSPYEVATNTSWTGAKIHITEGQTGPNSESGKKDIGDYERTGEGWKEIARALNYMSGGTQHRSGVLDFYPEDIKTILMPYIGTLLTLGEDIAATGGSIANGEMPKPTHVPVGKIVYGTDYDAADAARISHQKYENSHQWTKGFFGN
jgi:hypothetical protein